MPTESETDHEGAAEVAYDAAVDTFEALPLDDVYEVAQILEGRIHDLVNALAEDVRNAAKRALQRAAGQEVPET